MTAPTTCERAGCDVPLPLKVGRGRFRHFCSGACKEAARKVRVQAERG